jgi:hypothetical protein
MTLLIVSSLLSPTQMAAPGRQGCLLCSLLKVKNRAWNVEGALRMSADSPKYLLNEQMSQDFFPLSLLL